MPINSLILENFKIFRNATFKFKKYNIITGSNDSGKSTIIHAILTSLKTLTSDPIVRDVVFSFENIEDIIHNHDVEKVTRIEVNGSLPLNYINENLDFSLRLRLSRNNGIIITDVSIGNVQLQDKEVLQATYSYIIKEARIGKYIIRLIPHHLQHTVFNVKVFYPRISIINVDEGLLLLEDAFPSIIYKHVCIIPSLRSFITSKSKLDFLDTSSSIIIKLLEQPKIKYKVSQVLTSIFGREIIIDVKKVKGFDEFYIEDLSSGNRFSLESSSLAQILYVIVHTLSLPKNSTLIIEEPEVHLHPKMQRKFMNELLKLCNENDLQLIITTHSEYIIKSLDNVRNEVVIYYLERSRDNVHIINFDSNLDEVLKKFKQDLEG